MKKVVKLCFLVFLFTLMAGCDGLATNPSDTTGSLDTTYEGTTNLPTDNTTDDTTSANGTDLPITTEVPTTEVLTTVEPATDLPTSENVSTDDGSTTDEGDISELSMPINLTIDEDSHILSFDMVDGADTYDIYVNDVLQDTIHTNSYDFTSILADKLIFRVRAKASLGDLQSMKSLSIAYVDNASIEKNLLKNAMENESMGFTDNDTMARELINKGFRSSDFTRLMTQYNQMREGMDQVASISEIYALIDVFMSDLDRDQVEALIYGLIKVQMRASLQEDYDYYLSLNGTCRYYDTYEGYCRSYYDYDEELDDIGQMLDMIDNHIEQTVASAMVVYDYFVRMENLINQELLSNADSLQGDIENQVMTDIQIRLMVTMKNNLINQMLASKPSIDEMNLMVQTIKAFYEVSFQTDSEDTLITSIELAEQVDNLMVLMMNTIKEIDYDYVKSFIDMNLYYGNISYQEFFVIENIDLLNRVLEDNQLMIEDLMNVMTLENQQKLVDAFIWNMLSILYYLGDDDSYEYLEDLSGLVDINDIHQLLSFAGDELDSYIDYLVDNDYPLLDYIFQMMAFESSYNQAYIHLIQSDDGPDSLNFEINENLDPGTYQVEVYAYGDATGDYQLIVENLDTEEIYLSKNATLMQGQSHVYSFTLNNYMHFDTSVKIYTISAIDTVGDLYILNEAYQPSTLSEEETMRAMFGEILKMASDFSDNVDQETHEAFLKIILGLVESYITYADLQLELEDADLVMALFNEAKTLILSSSSDQVAFIQYIMNYLEEEPYLYDLLTSLSLDEDSESGRLQLAISMANLVNDVYDAKNTEIDSMQDALIDFISKEAFMTLNDMTQADITAIENDIDDLIAEFVAQAIIIKDYDGELSEQETIEVNTFLGMLGIEEISLPSEKFPIDGEFKAYAYDILQGYPRIVEVTVTINNGKIAYYNLDELRFSRSMGTWNEQTLKEMRYGLGMHEYSDIGLEWFEQAQNIEDYWYEEGIESVQVVDGIIDNISGVSIADLDYNAMALQALENARNGIFKDYTTYDDENGSYIIFSSMTLNTDGSISTLEVDEVSVEYDGSYYSFAETTKSDSDASYGQDTNVLVNYIITYGMEGLEYLYYHDLDSIDDFSGISNALNREVEVIYQILNRPEIIPYYKSLEQGIEQEEITIKVYQHLFGYVDYTINQYISEYNMTNDYLYPYEIIIENLEYYNHDYMINSILNNYRNAPDIFVLNNNYNQRLIEDNFAAIFKDQALINQIEDLNIEFTYNDLMSEQAYLYGAPLAGSYLCLYYDKSILSSEDVQSWESMMAIANNQGLATTLMPNISDYKNTFLYSFLENGQRTTAYFDNNNPGNIDLSNDYAVSIMKWTQELFSSPYGVVFDFYYDDLDFRGQSLSIVASSELYHHLNEIMGDDLGVVRLPSFTLGEDHVYGSVQAGTKIIPGSSLYWESLFVNKNSVHKEEAMNIIKILTKKDALIEGFNTNGLGLISDSLDISDFADTEKHDMIQAHLDSLTYLVNNRTYLFENQWSIDMEMISDLFDGVHELDRYTSPSYVSDQTIVDILDIIEEILQGRVVSDYERSLYDIQISFNEENSSYNLDEINIPYSYLSRIDDFDWQSSHPEIISENGFVYPLAINADPVEVTLTLHILGEDGNDYYRDFYLVVEGSEENEISYTENFTLTNTSEEYSITENQSIQLFFDEKHDYPYIDIQNFFNILDGAITPEILNFEMLNDHEMLIYYDEIYLDDDGVTEITERHSASLDFEANTLTVSNFEFFSTYLAQRSSDFFDGLNYLDVDYYEGQAVTIPLGEYRFDLIVHEDQDQTYYLMPLVLADTIFLSNHNFHLYYNGDQLYGVDTFDLNNLNNTVIDEIHSSSYTNHWLSNDMKFASINSLAIVIDYFYGLKTEKDIDNFYDFLDADLRDILSQVNYGIYELVFDSIYALDDLHSGHIMYGYYIYESLAGLSISDIGPNSMVFYEKLWDLQDLLLEKFGTDIDGFVDIPEYSLIDSDRVAIIHLTEFTIDTPDDFKAILDILPSSVEDVVIDVSFNTGENLGAVLRMFGYITEDTFTYSLQNPVDGSAVTYYIESDYLAYDYNWYVLTSSVTYSAANLFASIAKELDIPVIGQKSSGGASSISTFVLTDGSIVFISSNNVMSTRTGNDIDGYEYTSIENGIEVDYYLADVTSDSELISAINQDKNQ